MVRSAPIATAAHKAVSLAAAASPCRWKSGSPCRHQVADAVSEFDDAACPLGFESQRVEFIARMIADLPRCGISRAGAPSTGMGGEGVSVPLMGDG